jgi:hypothetical protein
VLEKILLYIEFWFGKLKEQDYLGHLSFVRNYGETGCKNVNWNLQVPQKQEFS